jgi:hypothetical protein
MQGDKSPIRYVGYDAEWDEWVAADRCKVYPEEDARNSAATATLPERTALADPAINAPPLVHGTPCWWNGVSTGGPLRFETGRRPLLDPLQELRKPLGRMGERGEAPSLVYSRNE